MKKRLFSIISALLSLVFVLVFSCKNSSNALQSKTLRPEGETLTTMLTPSARSSKNHSAAEENVWDVSGVDISAVNPNRKLIALTFDDAPVKTLERIVSVFLRFNASHPDCLASATLFCNGTHITASTISSLHAAYAAGFELGNHTQTHRRLTALSFPEIQREMIETDNLLQRIDGQTLHLLRVPYGELNELVRQAANAPIIDWLIDTLDWTGKPVEEIHQTVIRQKADGAIVLMHDGYENTVLALKTLLPDLYENGYQAVSVSQMAKAHSVTLKNGNVYIRARKIS